MSMVIPPKLPEFTPQQSKEVAHLGHALRRRFPRLDLELYERPWEQQVIIVVRQRGVPFVRERITWPLQAITDVDAISKRVLAIAYPELTPA